MEQITNEQLVAKIQAGENTAENEQYLTPYPIMHIGIDSFQRTGYSEVERAVLGW